MDESLQSTENPTFEELDSYVEPQFKSKKSKKSKIETQITSDSYNTTQSANLDDMSNENQEIDESVADMNFEEIPEADNNVGEYQQHIIDAYNDLASKIDFAQYVGEDHWEKIHFPKVGRADQKSLLKRMLPGGSKDPKALGKPAPKGSLLKRIRNGVTTLVRDESNIIFGDPPRYDLNDDEEDPDGVDCDDLHRYAQKLRDIEDRDRQINPEFLVLQNGKTVYGVHEPDNDGKVKFQTRKPIYDRSADQKPDEHSLKKSFLSRLKRPFTRNKDKNVDDDISKSADETFNSTATRQSSRKSLDDDVTTVA